MEVNCRQTFFQFLDRCGQVVLRLMVWCEFIKEIKIDAVRAFIRPGVLIDGDVNTVNDIRDLLQPNPLPENSSHCCRH